MSQVSPQALYLNMNERSMLNSSQQIDLQIGPQAPNHLHPEPYIFLGSSSNFSQFNIQQHISSASGNNSNFELHHLQDHRDGAPYYAMPQYGQHPHPPTNLELGIPAGPAFYNLQMNPAPGSRMLPIPLHHGSVDQLAMPVDDGLRSLYKRKDADGITGNVPYFSASAGSSSTISPMSGLNFDSAMDPSFPLPEYRGNGTVPIIEVGSQGIGRNGAMAAGLFRHSVRSHSYNHLLVGSFMGQTYHPSGATWLDQQSINSSDGGTLPWNVTPPLPCFQGSNIQGGSLEIGNAGAIGFHEAAPNQGSANFLHSPPIINQHYNLHPASGVQGLRGYCMNYHPPVAATSSRHPANNATQHVAIGNSPDDIELLPPPNGIQMYQSHRRGVLPETISRHRNVPHLQILPADEVAILEFPSLYEVGNFVDHHRDLRLDIDDMSYEELLALSDRIGNVNTGLSEEAITKHLKTRLYSSLSAASINLEELPCIDQKNDSCIICLDEYKDNDRIGTLDCGHEYHADCLKKWLHLKSLCPICKSTALICS
ncbi:hypothetical protein Nepgr_026778 [Nepenthes gracilis]|uniref:RING-type E3 ubiquitin transferase n=1 Tax=Nepenthes gracilis TaxID=150966 RepID=A0AAD3T7G0_NEPGR|nr:hypothetical protein Nepgr_026778 [Nepenthes gracilis]